ncbi:MAG: helix-turn-helix transcriptional regulator, partial [Nannocystaceae bacterium]
LRFPSRVDLPLQVLEFRLSALMSFVRAWLGDEWKPKSVDVSSGDRGSAATFERISNGASMNFNSKMTGFVIPIELAHRAACGAQTTLRFRAQHACAVALEHGCLNEKTVSSFLGLSSRSLHRKLRVEGTTLRQLYEELRRERAVLYLTQTQLPIAEVARYLGYDLQRNFTRAFRRWEGCSPREARSRSRLGGMLSE